MGVQNNNGLIGLEHIVKGVDTYVESQIVAMVGDLHQTLVAATPIEDPPTNNIVARQHWQISVDSYTKAGSTGEAPYVGGVEIDMRFKNTSSFLKAPGKGSGLDGFSIRKSQNIVVFNDVPYMARLNRGWSKTQQPNPGWIEACIDQVQSRWGML